jgi:hypothetical protein
MLGDITMTALPGVDMMMCRDCLFHLRYVDILRFFENFVQQRIPYLLTTTHLLTHNRDIDRPGKWRQLNLRRPPFYFPEPLETIDDWIEGHPRRLLGLWNAGQVKGILPRLKRILAEQAALDAGKA